MERQIETELKKEDFSLLPSTQNEIIFYNNDENKYAYVIKKLEDELQLSIFFWSGKIEM